MLLLFSALFTEMTTALMLRHVCHQTYDPFRWILAPLYIAVANAACNDLFVDGYQFLLGYTVVACLKVIHFTYYVGKEISHKDGLNIHIFSIKKKEE